MSLINRKLRIDLVLFLIASLLQSAFYWILTITLTRRFGLQAVGELSYVLAVITPLSVLGGLQMKSYLLTKNSPDLLIQTKWLRLFFPTLLFIVAAIIFQVFESWIILVFLSVGLLKLTELWSDYCQASWQLKEGLKQVNISLFYRYLSLFFTLGLCLLLNFNFSTSLFALAFMSLIIMIVDHFRSGVHHIKMSAAGSQSTFLVTLSLSLSSLLASLLVNIPRYQLKHYFTLTDLGMFSVLFYYYVLPSMVINYSCQGLLKHLSETKTKYASLKYITAGVGLSALLYFFVLYFAGEDLNAFIYQESPVWNMRIILFITLAFFLGGVASILHYMLMAKQNYRIQLRTNIVSALVVFLIGFLVIPKMGIEGAFISFVSGLLVQFLSYTYVYNRIK